MFKNDAGMKVFEKSELLTDKLVFFTEENIIDGDVATSTLTIAHYFGKRHDNILANVEKLKKDCFPCITTFSDWRCAKDIDTKEKLKEYTNIGIDKPSLNSRGVVKSNLTSSNLRGGVEKSKSKEVKPDKTGVYQFFLNKPESFRMLNAKQYYSLPRLYRYEEVRYLDSMNSPRKAILLNDELTLLLCMGFEGKKAIPLKTTLIIGFKYGLEKAREKRNKRIEGKLARSSFRDSIEKHVFDSDCPYNKMAFVTNEIYKKLFNKDAEELRQELNVPAGLSLRDYFSADQIYQIKEMERMLGENLYFDSFNTALERAFFVLKKNIENS